MRMFALTTALVTSFIVVVAACKKDDPPPTAPTASAYPGYPPGYTAYPPPGPGPQPTAYPTGPATAYPTGPAPVPAPTPATTATMAVPGPLAFPCQNDGACGLHHCNMQFQKCAFPCVNADVDCIQGNSCLGGICVPKPPGS